MEGNEKRAIIAIGITMLLITVYSYFYLPSHTNQTPKKGAQQTQVVKTKAQTALPGSTNAVTTTVAPKQIKERLVDVNTDYYTISISNKNGAIKRFVLKKYHLDKKPVTLVASTGAYNTLETVFKDKQVENVEKGTPYTFDKNSIVLNKKGEKTTLTLTKTLNGITIVKKYIFTNDNYAIDFSVKVLKDGKPLKEEFSVYAGPNLGDLEKSKYSHLGAVALVKEKKIRKDEKIKPDEDINWIALESKYFCFAFLPAESNRLVAGYTNLKGKHYIYANLYAPAAVEIYGGPKSKEDIAVVDHKLSKIIRFGMFGFIGKPLLSVLNFLYSIVGNYGIAIIILTFFIRILFYPLSFKSYKSMKEMSKLQPKLKELQLKYKGKPDLLNKATMELYKKHKVNPFGGCLPVVIQIPVFLALYNVLLNAIELRGAPFAFWITDLSTKDPYYILPIIMGLTMFIQQKLTPSTMDPKQQKIMMFMPLIFTVMFLSFPSGLVIYWTTNNILTILQQFIDSKILQAKEKNV